MLHLRFVTVLPIAVLAAEQTHGSVPQGADAGSLRYRDCAPRRGKSHANLRRMIGAFSVF